MINWISTWAEQLIVALMIGTIIEMILPNGNNKKYIKAVIGVYILFTIVSPVISNFTKIDFNKIDYEKYFNELDTKQAMSQSLASTNDKTIEEIYINNLKQDMKIKLKNKGYIVENIAINIELEEANYGSINIVWLTVYKEEKDEKEEESKNTISVNKIEEINIGNNTTNSNTNKNKKEINDSDKDAIKEYLSSEYGVKKKDIKINE